MRKICLFVLVASSAAHASEATRSAWILSASNYGAAQSRPDVHSVAVSDEDVTVRSAGISLRYLGPLQQRPIPVERLQQFEFRIPLHPEAETGLHARVPLDVIGVFVNGLPIWNQFEALSWNGANIWHYDPIAQKDDGSITATGRTREGLAHPARPGLLEKLIDDESGHSPLIGFALDGYPVYGPWAWAKTDGTGELRRMRSSYKLRFIRQRQTWPDGIRVTPGQYGPDVGAADPIGTFAEDYEYIGGSGDLDEFNGRFSVTPEYPNGTYAYFLTTDAAGRLAFPYLIGPRYYGQVRLPESEQWHAVGTKRISLAVDTLPIATGGPVRFRLAAANSFGEPIRTFEYVHERPIHMLIVSADLEIFEHVHPDVTPSGSFEVAHTFRDAGRYRVWVDYSLPGETPRVEDFDLEVTGPARPATQLVASTSLTRSAGLMQVTLTPTMTLAAGQDIPFTIGFSGPTDGLQPYLGAWAHVIVVGDGWRSFAHAHPIEQANGDRSVHNHQNAGPPPAEVRILTSFPCAGRYKLWVQIQNAGQVHTLPFVLNVAPAAARTKRVGSDVPQDAQRIRVSQHGYEPAIVRVEAGMPVSLAFTRESSPNCGSEIVVPSAGIRKALPLGETVVIELPAQPAGQISFSCGMGMYRGAIVAR